MKENLHILYEAKLYSSYLFIVFKYIFTFYYYIIQNFYILNKYLMLLLFNKSHFLVFFNKMKYQWNWN